ncbi:MAG: hypothetical protein RR700_06425 [Anaerorhabdus sp.]|uniref:hypothetical protein n=1 Tax=Anaerorhabdus sp. TaxID=1872524 RepID=UPI002FC58C78
MKKSSRQFLNLNKITSISLAGYNGIHDIYYQVEPFNLSVLSNDTIQQKITSLMNVIKGFGNIELVCMNSKENFEANKIFYTDRIQQEDNDVIRQLLEYDRVMLDELQINTATARLFLFCIKVREEKGKSIQTLLNRVEKTLASNGLSVKRLDKDGIKTMLSVYHTQNVVTERYGDLEGEEWYEKE